MGNVLDANSKPVAHRDETVETTATQSCNLSVDSPPEAARPTKPKVAPRTVPTQNLSWRLHYKCGQDHMSDSCETT